MTPTTIAAAAAPTSTSVRPAPPFFCRSAGTDGRLDGLLDVRPGRPDGGREGAFATGDSRDVRGGSDVGCRGADAPGDIPATIARALLASSGWAPLASARGASGMGESNLCTVTSSAPLRCGATAPPGGDTEPFAPGADPAEEATAAAEPEKSGLVPMSSIDPPASRSASSRSSAACFMTVGSCFASSGSGRALFLGNMSAEPVARGGAADVAGRAGWGIGAWTLPRPTMVALPGRTGAAGGGGGPFDATLAATRGAAGAGGASDGGWSVAGGDVASTSAS